MTSDDRIAKLERDLRHTRLGMLLLVVAGAVAIIWGRPRQPDEIVFGDVKIDRSGVTIQPSDRDFGQLRNARSDQPNWLRREGGGSTAKRSSRPSLRSPRRLIRSQASRRASLISGSRKFS
jgi:hypothetical protein